jgi:hypothetical protein
MTHGLKNKKRKSRFDNEIVKTLDWNIISNTNKFGFNIRARHCLLLLCKKKEEQIQGVRKLWSQKKGVWRDSNSYLMPKACANILS